MNRRKRRNILLVEPGFKVKFPPLGLMKISTYHKLLGDEVLFHKDTKFKEELSYRYWDRIYISTLFTYHWDITVKTINTYKSLVDDHSRVIVGGVLASLMPNDLWEETGIFPITGLLDKPHLLDEDNDFVVDELVPDYKLFDNSSFKYDLLDESYIGYSTRGCPNKCSFCGVPTIEPIFKDFIDIKKNVTEISQMYGEKQNLILLDNNVLASKQFNSIITTILDLGFHRGAKYNNRQRQVDYNQGVDARLINESKMKQLSKISIHPLRIAFDDIKLEPKYVHSIELAAKYGVMHLSNYLLYNYKDTPEDLWRRMKINIDLNHRLNLKIYSFPMKYIPLTGSNSKNRKYISEPNWNWQFIRGVQRILNVLKGSVMAREDFFVRAFGQNEYEFRRILHMPESLIMSRGRYVSSDERNWITKFESLSNNERSTLLDILCKNRTRRSLIHASTKILNNKLKNILEYYLVGNDTSQLVLELA